MALNKIDNIGGGAKLVDINPNKITSGNIAGKLMIGSESGGAKSYIPICGYKKLALFRGSSDTVTFKWVYDDGTESSDIETLTRNVWTDYYSIPNNAICVRLTATYSSTSDSEVYYSLLV